MISLAIDTAGSLCAVALHDSDRNAILAERTEELGRGHAERLMDLVAEALAQAGIDYAALGRVIATAGPGSFTGIRVGLATARGIALGLGIDAVGANALEAVAEHCRETGSWDGSSPLLAVQDAKRGEAYAMFLGDCAAAGIPDGPFVAPWHRLAALARQLDGLSLCGTGAMHVNVAAGSSLPVLNELASPPVATIARLGARLDPGEARPEPLYLRSPDAKPQEGFAVRRA